MRKAAERGFQTADHDGHILAEGLTGAVGVNNARPVWPQAGFFAGRIKILAPALFRGSVVGNHTVKIPRADKNAVARPAHGEKSRIVVPGRLGKHRNLEALVLQNACDDRRAKARVVNVGVPRDDEKIVAVPAAGNHILF